MSMDSPNQQRYYASNEYILPADEAETKRLTLQQPIFVRAFENRLFLAPGNFETGDRVLEIGAGNGIWALEFDQQLKNQGIMLEIECIDITDKMYPTTHPSNIQFSVRSVLELPAKWTGAFSYAHQRLVSGAFDDARWHKVLDGISQVLVPGGWLELFDYDPEETSFAVGPYSKRLESLHLEMFTSRGIIINLGAYLPRLLEELGFVDVRREPRRFYLGKSGDGYRYPGNQWRDLWLGAKEVLVNGGFVQSGEEYEKVLEESVLEWENSTKASATFFIVVARKP
ncbi:hypothetical protein D9757_007408 [Collybiopsis confluens]|uniref:S-adenosyl-L-methionine-dependent methyltransferase n=1 Tax=Collybiopsis confluens TaxID=2823264 RepID=A0A8H5HIH1_9AGAR|nr:hypothetical protein D9757_007408 [Collybiopsis confluens]